MHPVDRLAKILFSRPGKSEPEALPFQRKVYDLIEQNRNIVLQAPTGSGKTFAALAPFVLEAWGKNGGPAARKLIYSLPLRVLAGSLKAEYEAALSKHEKINFTSQYGGAADDPFLDGGDKFWSPLHDDDEKDASIKHAIFTTIDQTLSGFIGVPVGISNRQANMLYGSILSGALVFDEFHLLKSDDDTRGWSFGTALHLLGKTPWPFMIMTATMSTGLRNLICDRFNAEGVQVGEEDLPKIRSQYDTIKHLNISKNSINARDIISHLGNRTLIICNTVQRSQEVYQDLTVLLKGQSAKYKCLLLHSRFLPDHRSDKEGLVTHWFKEGSSEKAIVVATQVVEAGLNISCDVMHTEISPIDSFLQRIGRAARFGSEREAYIHVYPPEEPKKTKPYRCELVKNTLDALANCTKLEYNDLQSLIDPILGVQQCADFKLYLKQNCEFDKRIHQVRWEADKSANKELVRDINNAEIVIADPNQVRNAQISPWNYPAISIPQGSLWKFRNEGGILYGIKEEDDEIRQGFSKIYDLTPIATDEKVPSTRFIVPPAFASYTQDVGLILGTAGSFSFIPDIAVDKKSKYDNYSEEPYHLHLKRIYQQNGVRAAAVDALKRLQWENEDGKLTTASDPEAIVDLLIWSHDLAKLTDGWQKAHGDKSVPLAHGGRLFNPPPHALESAIIAGNLFKAIFGQEDIVKAIFLAICTHHNSRYDSIGRAQDLKAFRINETRIAYLQNNLKDTGTALSVEIKANWNRLNWQYKNLGIKLFNPRVNFDPLYALLVYILRRCDSLATSLANPKEIVSPGDSNQSPVHIISNFI